MKTLKSTIVLPIMAMFFLSATAKNQLAGLQFINQPQIAAAPSFELINTSGIQKIDKPVSAANLSEKSFRVYNNDKYQILSNTGINIYSKTWLVQQGKGPKPTELYFFSAGASGAILPLTLANLESVYGKNQKFMYAVESLFKTDAQLASYDYYNKQFKLAYLYSQYGM